MKKFIIAAIVGLVAITAQAQAIKVSTGSSSGTYSRVLKEAMPVCMNDVQIAEVNSTGSTQNVDRLVANEVQTAMVQTDVLFFRSRTEDLSKIKTLVAFNPEMVHVVTTAVPFKEGGIAGFGGKDVVYRNIGDLAGRTVVAAGGSYITAQVIRLQTEVQFNLIEAPTADEAVKAVVDGRATAAILVGGAPLGTVANLDKKFKLLSFTPEQIAKLKNVYRPATLNYSKMGSTGVQSVSTDAILVSREYKTPKMVAQLAALRKCIMNNAAELAETAGNHPAWQSVSVDNQGKWPWYDLPSGAPTKK